ncbi:PEGA domain-containing protein [bacterium]|nr:PEGA domain-containing protein [bacterium]
MKYRKVIFISLLLLLISQMCLYIFAQGVGYIQIKCEPGAIVFLDNNFVGNTSSELGGLILQDVPAGSHQIKIVKEGFEPQSVKIDLKVNEIYVYEVKEFSPQLNVIEKGEADTDTIKQRLGSLLIETIPIDCIIEIPKLNINKEHYGNKTKKTWEISNIPIGSYSVNFIALGKKIEYELKIEEGIQKHLLVNILNNEVKEIVPKSYSNQISPTTIGKTGPEGGLIFYDKGSYSDGWRYLEAAPASTEWRNIKWDSASPTEIRGTETGIGTGQGNTTKIIDIQGTGHTYAAQLCDALVYGGYDDWFLPSTEELLEMYATLVIAGVGGFASKWDDSLYWSSSECGQFGAEFCRFVGKGVYASGGEGNGSKWCENRVRAIRAF